MKIKKNRGGGCGGRVWGQGGCERRSEDFVKIQRKKSWGGGGSGQAGIRVNLNKELKFL